MVNGDSTRLAQCMVNLLNNAVKFTPRGGHIGLSVRRNDSTAVIEVTDSGIGISPASLERIFEPFVQEQPTGSHGNSGLGIGLALTRKLVVLHGGAVAARSEGSGRGSTFRIELPAAVAAGQPAAPTEAAVADGAGTKVLVVDDNRDAADTMREMLEMTGFDSSAEYNGRDALRAVQHAQPHAVLLDIGLPDIDGYEVCRQIKTGGEQAPLVIALTGWGQESDRKRAQLSGFDAHLTKPADPARVASLISSLLHRRRASPVTRP
jgi:CheY-like chemotaxis protein